MALSLLPLGLSHVLQHGMLLSSQLSAEMLRFLIQQKSSPAVPCGAEQIPQLVPCCRQAGLFSASLPPPGDVAGPRCSACPSGTAQCFPSDPLDLLFASSNSLCSGCCAVSLAETNRSPRCLQGSCSCLEESFCPGPSWATALCGEAQPDTVPSPSGEYLASSGACWFAVREHAMPTACRVQEVSSP